MKNLFENRVPRPAFTFIELLISITIIAILTTAIAVNFRQGALRAQFDEQVMQVTAVVEKARSLSLTNYLVDEIEPTEYYLLTIGRHALTVDAYGASVSERLESHSLGEDFLTDTTEILVYYIPPYGEICFEYPCIEGGLTKQKFTLSDKTGVYESILSINKYGGYPEVH